MTWTDRMMHDATGVSNADPVLVDYLLAKIEPPSARRWPSIIRAPRLSVPHCVAAASGPSVL